MNRTEILRYLRTNSKIDDPGVLSLVDRAAALVEANSSARTLYRIFDCTVKDACLIVGDYHFISRRLAQNLNGCTRVVIFGATLGMDIDRLIRANAASDIAMSMAIQASAACAIEEVCDALERQIMDSYGVTLRSRFSPGYYDLDIAEQKKIFEMLELTKRIGLTLTDSCEMLPTKSVTAFIGID